MLPIPKVHLCLDNSTMRPVMNMALLNAKHLVASDAHVLVRHSTAEILSEEVIKTIPKNGILLSKECLTDMAKRSALSMEILKTPMLVKVTHHQKYRDDFCRYHEYKLNGGDIVYPNYEAVIPGQDDREPVKTIGISAALLDRLADALGAEHAVYLEFNGADKSVYCTASQSIYEEGIGIVMPVLITK